MLLIVAALFALAVVFSPGAGLSRLRGFLLDAVGLGWLAVVVILVAGGLSMIGGRKTQEGETSVRASRNQAAVLMGLALLSMAVLGLLQLVLLQPAQFLSLHQQAGGLIGAFVASRLNDVLTAWGAAIVLLGAALFGSMLSFDLSLAALGEKIRPVQGEAPDQEEDEAAEPQVKLGGRLAREAALEREPRQPARLAPASPPEPIFPSLLEPPAPEPGSEADPVANLDPTEAEKARAAAQAEWDAAAAAAHEAATTSARSGSCRRRPCSTRWRPRPRSCRRRSSTTSR